MECYKLTRICYDDDENSHYEFVAIIFANNENTAKEKAIESGIDSRQMINSVLYSFEKLKESQNNKDVILCDLDKQYGENRN